LANKLEVKIDKGLAIKNLINVLLSIDISDKKTKLSFGCGKSLQR
jgi:hypothetical protein